VSGIYDSAIKICSGLKLDIHGFKPGSTFLGNLAFLGVKKKKKVSGRWGKKKINAH